MTGRGRMRTIKSVMMLPAALTYQAGRLSMQVPSPVQKADTGVQAKIARKIWDVLHPPMTTPAAMMTFLTIGRAKTR